MATVLAAGGAFIAAGIAFRQLKDQREAIERQGAEQARLATLQSKQLDQLNRQAETLRRAQAEQVEATFGPALCRLRGIEPAPGRFASLIVQNGSGRPIRRVRSRLVVAQAHYTSTTVCLQEAILRRTTVDEQKDRKTEPFMLRAGGDEWVIVWSMLHKPEQRFLLRFQDDAGVEWEINHELHLAEAPDSDW